MQTVAAQLRQGAENSSQAAAREARLIATLEKARVIMAEDRKRRVISGGQDTIGISVLCLVEKVLEDMKG